MKLSLISESDFIDYLPQNTHRTNEAPTAQPSQAQPVAVAPLRIQGSPTASRIVSPVSGEVYFLYSLLPHSFYGIAVFDVWNFNVWWWKDLEGSSSITQITSLDPPSRQHPDQSMLPSLICVVTSLPNDFGQSYQHGLKTS